MLKPTEKMRKTVAFCERRLGVKYKGLDDFHQMRKFIACYLDQARNTNLNKCSYEEKQK